MRAGGCLCAAIWPIYAQNAVRLTGKAACSEYRSDESGRWIRLFFCPRCGTTIYSTWEADPDEIALLGGTFDETRSKQHWFSLPPGAPAFEKSSRAASGAPR